MTKVAPAASGAGATGGGGDRAEHVLFVCSSGGHLAQLLALEPWWADRRTTWVTFPTADAESLLVGQTVIPAHYPTTRNVPNLLRNAVLAWRVLRRHRPDAVVSTGAGVALPFFVFARAMRIPTVYIEVFDRIDSATLTARLCRPFTDRLLVQWPEQQRLYRDTTVVGTLL
jgi:UDP-N-acetylglucosamine:LPS N-acetylglucosamine transferase